MPSLILLNKPDYLLPQVVGFLTHGWTGGLLDLSETTLVLPTQEARRRVHESLVRKVASQNSALLPPVWMLPMQLPEGNPSDLAPASLRQIVWMQIVAKMTLEESRRLFPLHVPQLEPARALEFANSIEKLRGELAQVGMRLCDAESQKSEDPRWKALTSLESRYLQAITDLGYSDRIIAQLEGVRNPKLPPQIKHLIIAGVTDLPNIYESLIPVIESSGIAVTLLSYDPRGMGESFFDPLGRPTERWSRIPIPIERSAIHLCADQTEQAEQASLLAQASGGKGTFCSIGVSTTALAQPVEDALQALHLPVFNPAGQPLDTLPIGCLLHRLDDQLQEESFLSCLQLLRHPDCQRWLRLDPVRDLQALDELHTHLIPISLDDLLSRWPENPIPRITISESLRPSLLLLQNLLSTVRLGHGADPLLESLRLIYQDSDIAQIAGGKESVERLCAWVQGAKELINTMRSNELLTLLLAQLQSEIYTQLKPPNAVELPGWLELLWEDAPHLIIAGMNDGLVPESRQEDPFLHERLRMEWKMSNDSSRLRRDSYFLYCMMAARAEKYGRLDLLLARIDEAGAVLKPSRLLLRPKNEIELPLLVQELFCELPPLPSEQWQASWALKPGQKPIPETFSASAIRDYLACPTRFYLKHILKLRKQSFGIEEADGAIFGTLLHDTLRDFGNDPHLKNLRDKHQIEAALTKLWKELFQARFGTDLSFPLHYQLEAGIRRLRGAARVQSELRAEGWEIIACERSFSGFLIPIAGTDMMMRGQIDRIDRRVTPQGTEWRILDYKSSEIGKSPFQQHLQSLKKRDNPAQFLSCECIEIDGKQHRWIDLQLPLYQMVLSRELESGHSPYLGLDQISPGSVEAGYLSLPAKISASAFLPFAEADSLASSADDCLRGVLQAIREGIFWPPRQPEYDDFESLFFDQMKAAPSSGQQTLDPANLMPRKLDEFL